MNVHVDAAQIQQKTEVTLVRLFANNAVMIGQRLAQHLGNSIFLFLLHWSMKLIMVHITQKVNLKYLFVYSNKCSDDVGYLLPEYPLKFGSNWKCNRCAFEQEEAAVTELTTKLIGKQENHGECNDVLVVVIG